MLRLRDIMTTDVVALPPEMTLRGAMETLASHHVSGAPVVAANGTVLGIISSTDLLGFAASLSGATAGEDGDPGSRLEPNEWDVDPGDREDVGVPSGTFFTHLWSSTDLDASDRMAQAEPETEWNVLEEHTVDEAMTKAVCSMPASAAVTHAAEFMHRVGVHRLLVTDDDHHALVGVVSTMDITRAVAEHQLVSRTYVFSR